MKKLKEKKRIQKMKRRNQESSDSDSPYSPNNSSGDESVAPQKRKGTIWKILFPDKKYDDPAFELERLVCTQVEFQISKDPKVIKSYQELKVFEESEECKQMTKAEYTKKKNRISAQLSRERREAIMHSLINVCIQNIKAKKELDEVEGDIDEARQILKDTLCDTCCTKLKGATLQKEAPSTLGIKPSKGPKVTPKKNNPGIVVSRPGTWGLLMSFAVIACVFSVAFLNVNESSRSERGPIGTELIHSRYLREDPELYNDLVREISEDDEELLNNLPDVYSNDLLK